MVFDLHKGFNLILQPPNKEQLFKILPIRLLSDDILKHFFFAEAEIQGRLQFFQTTSAQHLNA